MNGFRRDLTDVAGTVRHHKAISLRLCDYCRAGIHVGHEYVAHRPEVTSSVTYYYHPECVVLP